MNSLLAMTPYYIEIIHPLRTSIPPELGKLENRLAARSEKVRFFITFNEVWGLLELYQLPPKEHPASPLNNNMDIHGLLNALPIRTINKDRRADLNYAAHTSATK